MAKKLNFRQRRKIINRRRKYRGLMRRSAPAVRLFRRRLFKLVRFFVYFVFRLWLKRVHNKEGLPMDGPAIIVSNHLSYYDWAVLSAIYWDRYLAFIGNRDLLKRFFVGWLMKLNILIFIDPQNPGLEYFKKSLRALHDGHILVIYPEGTRSRSGKMLEPKTGFVKLALRTGAPVIPVAMRGTFEILPSHHIMPAFRRCEVMVGNPIVIDRKNPLFADIFKSKASLEEQEKQVAFIIMQRVREMANQEWDQTVLSKYSLKKESMSECRTLAD